jgi:hypothetical protein
MIRPVPLLLPSVCDGRRASRRLELVSAVATRRAPVSPVPGWAGAPAPNERAVAVGGVTRHRESLVMSAVSGTVRLCTPHPPAARGPVGVAGVVAAAQPARQGGPHGSAAREACMARPSTRPRGCVAQQVGGPSRAGRGAGVRRGFGHAVRCPERAARSRPRPRAECRSGDVGSWTRIDGRRRCACEVPSTDATQRAAPIVRRAPRAVWSAAESRPAGRTQGGHGTNSVAAVAGSTCAPARTPPPDGTDGGATALPSADADGGSVRAASSQTRTRRGARVDTAGRRAPSPADASGVSLRWRSVPGVCRSAGRRRARA